MPRRAGRSRRRSSQRRDSDTRSDQKAGEQVVARGVWSGSITFGLVTIPVELFSATRRSAVGLRMLGPDGTPLARRYACSAEGKPLDDDEIERGYEVAGGEFVLVTDEELERLAPRRSRDIELQRFVDRDAIDPAYFVRPYFVLPGAEQTKGYRLLAETMESTGRAGLATFVMRGKSYAVALFAERGMLRAQTLRYGDELRSPQSVGLPRARANASLVKRFTSAIAKLEEKELDESELSNPDLARPLELARAKLRRREDVVEVAEEAEAAAESAATEEGAAASEGAEVIDLFSLIRQRLRESPHQTRRRSAGATASRSHGVRKARGRRRRAAR